MVFYAIAGWIVIEVASTVLPGLNLPDWTTTLVIVLVALGFIVAVMLAWAFDIGPRGVERTTDRAKNPATNAPGETVPRQPDTATAHAQPTPTIPEPELTVAEPASATDATTREYHTVAVTVTGPAETLPGSDQV